MPKQMTYAFDSLMPLFVTSQFNTSASPEKIQMDWNTMIVSEFIALDAFTGQIRGAAKQKPDKANSLIHSNRWE
tara:strand:+ start:454 stop:675 length:222 start_codon:yes stop_codon:yes gene_type:complete